MLLLILRLWLLWLSAFPVLRSLLLLPTAATVLFLAVLELLVEVADRVNALFSLFLPLKLERHGHLLELVPLEGELIVALGLLIQGPEHGPTASLVALGRLEDALVVLTLLGYAIVEGYNLGGRLARRDLDQVVHEEAALEHGIGLGPVGPPYDDLVGELVRLLGRRGDAGVQGLATAAPIALAELPLVQLLGGLPDVVRLLKDGDSEGRDEDLGHDLQVEGELASELECALTGRQACGCEDVSATVAP